MSTPLPARARVLLTHAALQVVANQTGARILHFKGPAVHAELVGEHPRYSTDADVLVHPDDVERYMRALATVGFDLVTHFETGSAFEHAACLWHLTLGWADVHRHFPGFGVTPADAFEVLWAERIEIELAAQACAVPSLTAQRLMLLLHAARSGMVRLEDIDRNWHMATEADREATRKLADRLTAQLALAAATGKLGDFEHHREHDLWELFSRQDQERLQQWRARIKAAPTFRERLRLAFRSLRVNTDAMAMQLHRRPTRSEVAKEYFNRLGTAVSELLALAKRRLRRRK